MLLKECTVLSKDLLKEEARLCGEKTMEDEVVLQESLEGRTTKKFSFKLDSRSWITR